jgi:hypothetical protein
MRTPFPSPDLDRPARGSHRQARTVGAVLFAAATWLGVVGHGLAIDPPLDLKLVNKAQTALTQVPELNGFLLGVEVKDRVAVVFGTLPSAELDRRAVDVLKKIPDFRAVRSDVRIDPEKKPFVEPGSPSRFRPDAYPPYQSTIPTGSLMKGPPKGEPPSTDHRRADAAPLAWQYAPGQGPRDEPAPTPAAGNGNVVAVDLSLDQAILVIRQGNPRFAGVRHELRSRVVSLSGTVATWDDVMDLARAISRLPGVERVVVAEVRTTPAGR